MAILSRLPEKAIIDGFKGTIDFYVYKGQPCARKWPTFHKRTPYDEERRNQEAFAYAVRLAGDISPAVVAAYQAMTAGTPLWWRDLFMRAYMAGIDY